MLKKAILKAVLRTRADYVPSLRDRSNPLHDLIAVHQTGLSSDLAPARKSEQAGNAGNLELVGDLIGFGIEFSK